MEKNSKLKNATEKTLNVFAIVFEAVIGLLIGIILYLIGLQFQNAQKDIFCFIGQLFISISGGSLLLEWFGYVNYTRKRMCEILCDNDVLNVLNTTRKRELKTALLNNLYMPNKNLGNNNIVEVIDNEMDNILKDYYFSEYIMYVDIRIHEENNKKFIKKTIRKTYTAETINNNQCSIERLLNIQISPVLDERTVQFGYLKINNEQINNISLQKDDNLDEVGNHYENYFFLDVNTLGKKLLFTDSISIDMEYTTYTDINDNVFSNQIDKPCKHYCIHFNYSDNITMDLVGFGFMTSGNPNKRRIVKTQNGHMLRFLDWILPGDGVMAALTIKDS